MSGFDGDAARGALLGLAVGDALGTTVEFRPRGSFAPVTGITGGGPFGLEPGQWTDDTAMALCLGDSLLARGGWDAGDCVRRFVNWRDWGVNSCTGSCFDIGNTTTAALSRFLATGDPYAGSTDPGTSGNGAIMRLAPAAIAYGDEPEAAARAAVLQGRTTHASAECDEIAARMARLLVTGDIAAAGGPGPEVPEREIRSTGYVRHTWEAALWAVRSTGSFRAALLKAVNLGDDADTVGAVTGQIAGRLYGAAAIPDEWLAPLAWREHIEEMAESLHGRVFSAPVEIASPTAQTRRRNTEGCR